MDSQFSQRVKDILGYSKEEAIRLGNSHISPEHLFLGILRDGEGVAIEILVNQGIDLLVLKGSLEKSIKVESPVPVADHEVIPLLRSTERILNWYILKQRLLRVLLSILSTCCLQFLRMRTLLSQGFSLSWMLTISQYAGWLKQNCLLPKLIFQGKKMMKGRVSAVRGRVSLQSIRPQILFRYACA